MPALLALFHDPRWSKTRWVAGTLLMLAGLALGRRSFNGFGNDLAQLYVAGHLLREGVNIYDWDLQHDGYMRHVGEIMTWGHFYTPGSSVAAVPVTLFPYPVARELWFFAGFIVMLYGTWRFMAVYLRSWGPSQRVVVMGLVMCSSCIRWGCWAGQPAALLLGIFSLFVVALKNGPFWKLVLYGGFMGTLKVTLGMPFLLLAAAQRRFAVVAALLGVWGALNLAGILGHGGFEILDDYRSNMAVFEDPQQLNYPDPRGVNSGSRTDWPYLLNAFWPNLAFNRVLGVLLTLGTLAWLAWLVHRQSETELRSDVVTLALIGPATSLSMLAVYHHPYDVTVMLLPILAYAGYAAFCGDRGAWLYMAVVGVYAGLHQEKNFAQLLERIMGDDSVLVARPLCVVVCITALLSSTSVLKKTIRELKTTMPTPSA